MRESIVYDLTSVSGILDSLSKHLELSKTDILNYLERVRNNFDLTQFLEDFRIEDERLLDCDISLISLHVTTNDDECADIRTNGIVNLQKVLTSETTLGKYLRSQGITVNVNNKEIQFNGHSYSLSENDNCDAIKRIYYKLYKDYQVNSFLSCNNALEYGVDMMPEFLENIAELLDSEEILDNWGEMNIKCSVVKFRVPLANFADDTFSQGRYKISEQEFQYSGSDKLNMLKRYWILNQSFDLLRFYLSYQQMKQIFGYLRFDEVVPSSSILKIYTPEEYLEEYRIDD
ncbi:hypothetical protein [Peribacillus deserti]|uniref:Uncharacterized protein n=1 Tax=Peribacillus deserti TaxID=673318 RepID=A0A2N5M648_9BACI|nr:hypothetical protein [Peribacillus deserti]PLT29830.1 hypothetical protein CUU66_11040 [Peribacillus deserti]